MKFDRPITIQIQDEATEQWTDLWKLHARVNKATGQEKVDGGANQAKATMTFEVRYFTALKQLFLNTQLYRIIYEGNAFDIVDYDDYMETHRTVKLKGEA